MIVVFKAGRSPQDQAAGAFEKRRPAVRQWQLKNAADI